jgi:predicted nucleic acid-binding protein
VAVSVTAKIEAYWRRYVASPPQSRGAPAGFVAEAFGDTPELIDRLAAATMKHGGDRRICTLGSDTRRRWRVRGYRSFRRRHGRWMTTCLH